MREGQRLGEVRVYDRGAARRAARRSSPRAAVERPGLAGARRLVREARTLARRPGSGLVLVIVTVTLNAAIDRTLTVPNFQRGHRHRASEGLTLAGGKGINIARALKRLDVPVVATGLAGGRTGTRIVEELTAEAILNDFVRIGDESRTSTAVVDPTAGTYTEINEWGPAVTPDELEILLEKLALPRRAARTSSSSPARCRAASRDGFYAEAIRELNRRGVRDGARRARASRCGSASRPSRSSSRRTSARRRASSARSSTTTRTSCMALDAIAELGARNVLITHEAGCFALLPRGRGARGASARPRRASSRSRRSARATCCSRAFLAARLEGAPPEEALRGAVAAGAASTLELGAGRFDPREAGRLLAGASRCAELRAGPVLDDAGPSERRLLRVDSPWSRREPERRELELGAAVELDRLLALDASSPRKGSRSTTCCSCRPSRRCCRTTSRRARG